MSRVITFSRTFPAYHPRKGEPTYFVEKIWAGLADITDRMQGNVDMDWYEYYNGVPKWHTIRAGNRWKVGDKFSPRYWTGRPYASKQALITEDIEIKKVFDFKLEKHSNRMFTIFVDGKDKHTDICEQIAKNDGLSLVDMFDWFNVHPKKVKDTFAGQIICWNEMVQYDTLPKPPKLIFSNPLFSNILKHYDA